MHLKEFIRSKQADEVSQGVWIIEVSMQALQEATRTYVRFYVSFSFYLYFLELI